MKRVLLPLLAVALAATLTAQSPSVLVPMRINFNIVEATISDMQAALESGRVTSRDLVALYMARIAAYEPTLNAVATLNLNAYSEADDLDRERASGRVRGPLHGIPIALKDNIHTTHMQTTGGGLAFAGFTPPYEATLTTNLRAAGAIIIAKTVLTEFANWVTVGMPANYSALFGYAMNPYDPRPDPRTGFNDGRPVLAVGGSSSGVGTAASLWAANVGTETSGSILSPSNSNMLVGIKPTLGRISRYGVIPIAAEQDTAGPMARTVADVAILMGALEGTSRDPNDSSIGTFTCTPPPGNDYTRFLRSAGLRGARIGIPRANFYAQTVNPATGALVGGITAAQLSVVTEAIEVLRREGAVLVDPANIPSVIDGTPANNWLTHPICAGLANRKGMDANCSVVFKYGFKRDLNAWLASLGSGAPVKTLTELRQYNQANQPRNAIKYNQEHFDISDEMDVNADRARYEADRAKDIYHSRTHGIDEAMAVNNLDALLFPGLGGQGISAEAGHPTIIVPFGTIPNALTNPELPAGFNAQPARFGVSFAGSACSEPRLIELAYAFEQATKRRVAPTQFP
jgi:amidase